MRSSTTSEYAIESEKIEGEFHATNDLFIPVLAQGMNEPNCEKGSEEE